MFLSRRVYTYIFLFEKICYVRSKGIRYIILYEKEDMLFKEVKGSGKNRSIEIKS